MCSCSSMTLLRSWRHGMMAHTSTVLKQMEAASLQRTSHEDEVVEATESIKEKASVDDLLDVL